MTRLIRINGCDMCPHAVGSRGCRKVQYDDENNITRIKLFGDQYPNIPDWCPLETVDDP